MGVCFMREKLSQEFLRSTFEYLPETGRLLRVRKGRGARVGAIVGHHTDDGFIRVNLFNRNWTNAHLVWVWHHGEFPPGILRRKNGINSDDRIENLEIIKKPLSVARTTCIHESDQYGRVTNGTSGIYEIVCTENGRRYIGSAVNIDKRWRGHVLQLNEKRHHSRHLQRAWNKYGQAAFVFVVLEECMKGELILREQHYIDCLKPAFNSRPQAASQLGYRHTDETRRKMSASRRKDFSPMAGKRHTEESLRRISENRKGKGIGPRSEEVIAKCAARMREAKGALGEAQVRAIKEMNAIGMRHADVAEKVGCSYWAVADVVRGRTFKWVD